MSARMLLELINCRVLSRPMTLVTLNAHGLLDYLLAVFDQSKRLDADNVKAKATRIKVKKLIKVKKRSTNKNVKRQSRIATSNKFCNC